ncbi:hypothetical protein Pla100_59920 [Neorhodopirellula pilleata]|uniref:Uncharacterized protein n=1 Tax=Neorhodopirellula pilleata TaxID=2714738 RepID=A0A5C5ZJP4_9BACT|nr:hypothetical protein Pla100_59920 [Neorhodopirellula pilleata]
MGIKISSYAAGQTQRGKRRVFVAKPPPPSLLSGSSWPGLSAIDGRKRHCPLWVELADDPFADQAIV